MSRERASIDFGDMTFNEPETSKPKRPPKIPVSKKDVERVSVKEGFLPRSGTPIDGRSLRSKGERTQMNMKVSPEFKNEFLLAAAEEGKTVAEFVETLFLSWKSKREG